MKFPPIKFPPIPLPIRKLLKKPWVIRSGIVFGIVALTVFSSLNYIAIYKKERACEKEATLKVIRVSMEYGYMEGQKDALSEDIKIERRDSVWVYKKSPWNGKTEIPDVIVPVDDSL